MNAEQNDLRVYVLTHKKTDHDLKYDDWHVPLHVGADASGLDICETKDNTGDNISSLNPAFWETTGIYWIWKNVKGLKYVGQEHYSRHFNVTRDECLNILNTHDIIVPVSMNLPITVERQYEHCHIGDDIHMAERIIAEKFPKYHHDYVVHIKGGNRLYNSNSFIASWQNYCDINEFVFSVLFEYKDRMGFHTVDDFHQHAITHQKKIIPTYHSTEDKMRWETYQADIGGFLYERLFTLYVMHNFGNVCELPLKVLH